MSRSDAWFVIVVSALWVCVAGLTWGTGTASGTDSYGYISEAQLLVDGDLVIDQPIAREVPWPDADWTFSPLGYRPGLERGTIVPVYPLGLPLVMALFQLVGGPGAVFFVVPLLGLVAVLATAGLAARMSNLTGGAVAALLVGASPTMFYAVMWPMSDVAATAWWAAAMFLATGAGVPSAAGSGFAAALAILTRPNLVGVAIAPGVYLLGRVWSGGSGRRLEIARLVSFVVPAVAGCLGVAAVFTALYGSPLESGHGELSQLFSTSLAPSNIVGFITRPFVVEPALVLLGMAGAGSYLVASGAGERPASRSIASLCVGAIVLVLASYLFYLNYPEWWYLRFLLPAYPAVAALGGAGVARGVQRVSDERRTIVLSVVAVVIVLLGAYRSGREGVVRVGVAEARYPAVGRFIERELPENAVLFAFQQSGSIRYYSGRLTLRYDLLGPEWLETAVGELGDRGYRPYFVVEEHDPSFRERFGAATPLGRLDWPAAARFDGEVTVEIFDPADRTRWLTGETIVTRPIEP